MTKTKKEISILSLIKRMRDRGVPFTKLGCLNNPVSHMRESRLSHPSKIANWRVKQQFLVF